MGLRRVENAGVHFAAKCTALRLRTEHNSDVAWGMPGGMQRIYAELIRFHPSYGSLPFREALRVYAQDPDTAIYGQHLKKLGQDKSILKPEPPKATKPPWKDYVQTDGFLRSFEWRKVRTLILTQYGARCMCCGATPSDGVRMHVDHIKPRKTHPELALDPANLQVLCEVCNHGKGNWDSTDWRSVASPDYETKH